MITQECPLAFQAKGDMEKILSLNFNGLYNMRYPITHHSNAMPELTFGVHNPMNAKYKKLIDFHLDKLAQCGKNNIQVQRNQISTLHSFLAFCGKTEDSYVGAELRNAFEPTLASFFEVLAQSTKTLSDKRGHMRSWKLSFDALQNSLTKNSSLVLPKGFTEALRNEVVKKGIAPKTLAVRSKISTSAMQRWMAGSMPNTQTLPSVRRLERELGLERGTLEKHLNVTGRAAEAIVKSPVCIEYRERLKKSRKLQYLLKEIDFRENLISEWKDYFSFKTSTYTPMKRRNSAVWRLLPLHSIQGQISFLAKKEDFGCPSGQAVLSRFRAYWGFLRLPESEGGYGLTDGSVQTLATLVVPEWLEAYFQFLKRRSGGKTHEGHLKFSHEVAAMTNPEFGYLTQISYYSRLTSEVTRGRTWEQLCQQAAAVARAWGRAATDVSRDPVLPILPLLRLEEPLAPLVRAISALDAAAAECFSGSVQQACLKRDALLLSLILENPLRIRTISLITYDGDNGNLYTAENQWRLRFKGDDFKNDSGSRNDDYDVGINGIGERIDDYLWNYRPNLINHCPECKLIFPSTRSPDGKFSDLGKVVSKITERYVPETLGFGPHGIRHLVASAYLKKNPKDFLTAAELLHDELSTVIKRYAHLSKDDSFKRYSAHVAEVRKNILR